MSTTILITGASSGIGKATAKLFQSKGWNVIAAMRTPEKETELNLLSNVSLVKIDVTDPASIDAGVKAALDKFGTIDVLLNNAGYGTYGPLEEFPRENIIRQFDTNVIGLIDMTKALIPHFRANKNGMFINISSVGGKVTFPLMPVYHATKWAVEGLTECLFYEMSTIGVKVKLIEPGGVATDFGGRSIDFKPSAIAEYQPLYAQMNGDNFPLAKPEEIAAIIYTAATDGTEQLRYAAPQAQPFFDDKIKLGDVEYNKMILKLFSGNS